MPIIDAQEYKPRWSQRNGHLGTLIPYLFHNKHPNPFTRERINTPDEDFIDVDKVINGNDKVVMLCHGLEGSAASNYILNMSSLLVGYDFDVLAINYRGCSGQMNNKLRMYHSGATDDIHTVLSHYESAYTSIALIGYSLGANMVTKYMGESTFEKSYKIKAAAGISAPCDLAACSAVISRSGNYIYEKRFLISLTNKLKAKAKLFPEEIDLSKVKTVKSLRDFDEYFTGPLHGFKNASEYYELNSSNKYLDDIKTPILIINAYNDPFLDPNYFPRKEAQDSEYVHLLIPKYGGHVGFMGLGQNYSWADLKALDFITSNISNI